MSEKELHRCNIIQQVNDHLITQVKAAEILKLTDRQVRNLLRSYQKKGPNGLTSKKRGKRSNNALCPDFEKEIIDLIFDHYDDFGPTFA